MNAPYFFHEMLDTNYADVELNTATFKHVVQVLRMKVGDVLKLTNGKGLEAKAEITEVSKKKCVVRCSDFKEQTRTRPSLSVGISLTRNTSRNEWVLEKLGEFGVQHIYIFASDHSVKSHFKLERFKQILISAMLQSQQVFLTELHSLDSFENALMTFGNHKLKLIAHCEESEEKKSIHSFLKTNEDTLVLIGPEGDFSSTEITKAMNVGFVPVHLGPKRLRTETAAMTVAAHHYLINHA